MIRPVEPPSSVGRQTCSMSYSLKSVSMFQAPGHSSLVPRQSHQSEAATKTIRDWAIRSSKEGDLVWFRVFSLPSLSFKVLSAFLLIEIAALNRRFFLFSVGKAG